jgi:RNA polymerase sigma-70 factor (ECF subfamily)
MMTIGIILLLFPVTAVSYSPNGRLAVAEDGEPFEIEQIYRDHSNWLVAFLKRRFGPQDAEDLAQEAYARAVSARPLIRNPRAFLAQVALNAARDLARRRAARPVLLSDDSAQKPISAASQTEALHLKQIILALPPKLQEVFLLSRFGGLTYEEIAHHCGISVKTVEGRMTKALAMCATLMD